MKARPRTLDRLVRLAPALALLVGLSLCAPAHAAEEASQAAMGALKLANHHYKAKNFTKAAKLYHEAFSIDPKAAFLFNAARAEMRAFEHDKAERDFKRYLTLSDASDKGRKRAQLHLDEIRAYRAKMAEGKRQAVAKAKAPIGGMTIGLWVAGGTLLVGGGALYGVAYAGRLSTNNKVIKVAEDVDNHQDEVEQQNSMRTIGLIAGGVGIGLATWATLRALGRDKKAAASWQVQPWSNGRGVGLVGRF